MKSKHILILAMLIVAYVSSYSQNDTIAPLLSKIPADTIIGCASLVPSAPYITATDNNKTIPVTFTEIISDSICKNLFHISRTWTASDNAGNTMSATQIINVVDTIAPLFSAYVSDITVENFDDIPPAPEIFAIDNCSNIPVIFEENLIDSILYRSWSAEDECFNISIMNQTITINNTATSLVYTERLSDITVYPNPSNGEFFVSGIPKGQVITIYDSNGKELTRRMANTNMEFFHLNCAAGVLFINILGEDKLKAKVVIK